jgi:O-acetyl-ADP-ribose deacetylase (regulator of RNase III)
MRMMDVEGVSIALEQGSLLDLKVDAMVNANNCRMRGGSGLNGRFHEVVGPGLLEQLKKKAPYGAPTAKPVVTAGDPLCPWVIHVAGPVYTGDARTYPGVELLHAYRNCVIQASQLQVTTLGFASLSTGIYGFPLYEAASIAVLAVAQAVLDLKALGKLAPKLGEIVFAMYGKDEYDAFFQALQAARCEQCLGFLTPETRDRVAKIYCRGCIAEGVELDETSPGWYTEAQLRAED